MILLKERNITSSPQNLPSFFGTSSESKETYKTVGSQNGLSWNRLLDIIQSIPTLPYTGMSFTRSGCSVLTVNMPMYEVAMTYQGNLLTVSYYPHHENFFPYILICSLFVGFCNPAWIAWVELKVPDG